MEWTTEHPIDPGLCWVSVHPKGRNPGPWRTLPPVFLIIIAPNGDVWEIGKDEPTYNVNDLPDSVKRNVKYLHVLIAKPQDPWPKDAD